MTVTPVYLKRNQAGLFINGLNVLGTTTDGNGRTFAIEAQDGESTWGNPIPIDTAVQRWMTDGAVAATEGHDNREIFFKVIVSAATSVALAAGEAALTKLSSTPTTLTWVPPEGAVLAPTTVFEIWTWHLESEFDMPREMRVARMYGVRMTAKPWARSKDFVTVAAPAVPGSPTTVSVDTCASVTGWTGFPDPPTTSGGAVKETHTGGSGQRQLIRTGSVTGLGTTPFLMIDMVATGPLASTSFFVAIDGVEISKVAQIGTVSYWQVPAGVTSFTTLQIAVVFNVTHGGPVVLSVADVSRTDTIGGIGSRKQLTRHLDVGGSVKTSGSIQIASPSATILGKVLVYTCADLDTGYSPPLRQYRTGGPTVTPDATCVSANREPLVTAGVSAGPTTYTIPAGQLPEGTYAVVGRFLFGAAGTLNMNIAANMAGTSPVTISGQVSALSGIPTWGIIGLISLPPVSQPAESLVATTVTAQGTVLTGTPTHNLDELYLLDVTHGAFTLLAGLGSSVNTKLWIDAPDVDLSRNRPAIYHGTLADKTDAVAMPSVQILSVGDHDLDPNGAQILTVTDGVDNAVVSATFYHRWHSSAGD